MRIIVGLSKKRMETTQCNTALVTAITGEVIGNSGEKFYCNFCLFRLCLMNVGFENCFLCRIYKKGTTTCYNVVELQML